MVDAWRFGMGKFWDWAIKILTVLVIPLLLWGISLEVRLAVQNSEMERLQQDVKEAQGLREGLQQNSNALGRLEEKLTATNNNLTEIKGLIRAGRQ